MPTHHSSGPSFCFIAEGLYPEAEWPMTENSLLRLLSGFPTSGWRGLWPQWVLQSLSNPVSPIFYLWVILRVFSRSQWQFSSKDMKDVLCETPHVLSTIWGGSISPGLTNFSWTLRFFYTLPNWMLHWGQEFMKSRDRCPVNESFCFLVPRVLLLSILRCPYWHVLGFGELVYVCPENSFHLKNRWQFKKIAQLLPRSTLGLEAVEWSVMGNGGAHDYGMQRPHAFFTRERFSSHWSEDHVVRMKLEWKERSWE